MNEPTQEEWAILLPAYRALKAEWEAGRKPVVITSARYEALMAAADALRLCKIAMDGGHLPGNTMTGDKAMTQTYAALAALRAAGIETGERRDENG